MPDLREGEEVSGQCRQAEAKTAETGRGHGRDHSHGPQVCPAGAEWLRLANIELRLTVLLSLGQLEALERNREMGDNRLTVNTALPGLPQLLVLAAMQAVSMDQASVANDDNDIFDRGELLTTLGSLYQA